MSLYGMGVAEKILQKHLLEGKLIPGKEIGLKIDQTLTQDATGTLVYLQFEALGVKQVKTELSLSYIDHNTIQDGFENADDHKYLKDVAQHYGIFYSKAGNGICHQVHLERFAVPGKTLLGSDSHTPTAGGMGMLAIGAGGLDVALAMAGEPFYFICPHIWKINLLGKLSPWVSAKDVILKILQILTTKGNVGKIIEYGGNGLKSLSIPERATIANMGAELGVTTSVFPSDEITRKFLKAQAREDVWEEVVPDRNAQYERVIEINLEKIVPLVAKPHSPDNVSSVGEVEGRKVEQVIIGSCTNSSYFDLMLAAYMLEDKKVHPEVSFVIAPGSRQVLKMLADNGALSTFIRAGARITEAVCGFCIGNSQAPETNGVSLRTNNRNFKGRSGTKSAYVYLVSPQTAVASALRGVITDPRRLGLDYPKISLPERFEVDDSLILPPSKKQKNIPIYRGPNIGKLPRNVALPDKISGQIMIKVGDKITTDHITPAGKRLKYRSNISRYAQYVFEEVDSSFSSRCLENKQKGKDNFILAGESYGQGSSREHAALCPMYLGVRAIIAKSFERIHRANLINYGILPLNFVNPQDYDKIESGDEVEISQTRNSLLVGKNILLKNKSKDFEVELTYNLSEREKQILLAGGVLNYFREKKR